MSRILIVDDEAGIRRSLAGILSDEGFEPSAVCDGDSAIRSIEEDGAPDLVLLDIAMPGRDGVEILVEITRRWPGLPVVMMSGHGTVESAVRTTRHGAYDFIEKPLSLDKVLLTIQHALEQVRLERENRNLRSQALRAHEIIGDSGAVRKLKEQIAVAAPTNGWVLIHGENGTGKELVARQIHCQSRRANGPFVEVNCAAIPEELIESELFGHEKGAFTGAVARRIGKFEEASGGTLLLDEISEMDARLQAKLLRAIQERVIDRVGGGKPVAVDIRIIATSNRNLVEAVRDGRFREDLLFRLNVVNLKIPPLRERPADVLELAQHFIKKYSDANGVTPRPLSAEARRALVLNRWPGNVRELENTLHRAVLLASGDEIGIDGIVTPDGLRLDQAKPPAAVTYAAMAAETVTRALVGRTVADVERDLILETLKHCLGNRTHAANILGISIRTLRNKLNEYAGDGVAIPPPGSGEARLAG